MDLFDGNTGTRVQTYHAAEGPRVAVIGLLQHKGEWLETHRATHSAADLQLLIADLTARLEAISVYRR